jgi:hypothetical protein
MLLALTLFSLLLTSAVCPAGVTTTEGLTRVGLSSAVTSGAGQGRWLFVNWYAYSAGKLGFFVTDSGPQAGWTLPGFADQGWDEQTEVVWDAWWDVNFTRPYIAEIGPHAMVGRQGFANRATYLFRRQFDLPDAPAGYVLRTVELRAWSDNNAVFYINGQLIFISAFPASVSQPYTPRQLDLRPSGNVLALQLSNDDQPYNPIGVQFLLLLNYDPAPVLPSPTGTATPTATPLLPTPSATLPPYPLPEASATPTPAGSATPTATLTTTATSTATLTRTATASATPTASATATLTPTATCTPTASATPTLPPTATCTPAASATPTLTPTPRPVLRVSVSDWHDPLVASWSQRYTIVVSNLGPGEAYDVVLRDAIPPLTQPLLARSTAGAALEEGHVAWELGTLAEGEAVTLYLELGTSRALGHCSYLANRVEAQGRGTDTAGAVSYTLIVQPGQPSCHAVIFP